MKNECSCKECKNACKSKPGWFMPGEAEKAANLLNMPFDEFFKKYLAVDWYNNATVDYFIISPAAKNNPTGDMFPYNPTGECVFFDGEKCAIHESKPFECKEYIHEDSHETCKNRHKKIAFSWANKYFYITNLLGREPNRPEPKNISEKYGFFNI